MDGYVYRFVKCVNTFRGNVNTFIKCVAALDGYAYRFVKYVSKFRGNVNTFIKCVATSGGNADTLVKCVAIMEGVKEETPKTTTLKELNPIVQFFVHPFPIHQK